MTGTYPVPRARRSSRAGSLSKPLRVKSPSSSARLTTASTEESGADIETKRQAIYSGANSSDESVCLGHRRGLCFASSTGPRPEIRAALRGTMPSMDCNEFDNLPPAIRRKYFSSLERLRYAQQSSASVNYRSPQNHARIPSNLSGMRGRESSDSLGPLTNSRKQQNLAEAFVFSQSDARWFLELPETVRRKHFSPEEREILTVKCKSVIGDAADEQLARASWRNRSTSRDSIKSDTSDVASLRRNSIDEDIQMAKDEVRRSFRWMEEDGDLDLQLRQFQEQPSPPRRRKRRTLSLSKARRSSSVSSTTSFRGRAPAVNRRISMGAQPIFPSAPIKRLVAPAPDPDAAYYQDPDARLKLRVYLASPQKFDEAIEFGFPSQAEAEGFFGKPRPSVPTVTKVPDELVEDADHDTSLSKSGSNDGIPPENTDGNMQDQPFVLSGLRSKNNGSGSSKYRTTLDHYTQLSPGNREMTLKMTLTRPDLRAADIRTSSYDRQYLLDELPPLELSQIDWDAIDRESATGLRKLWRKMKGAH